jgi:hypothetical protein
MFYDYICDTCGAEKEIARSPVTDKIPQHLRCTECLSNGKKSWMNRNWNSRIHIPDWFKATNEEQDGDNPTNLSHLKDRMNHTRPSGKEKIYY